MVICVMDILVVNAALSINRQGKVENGWLRIRAESFVFIYAHIAETLATSLSPSLFLFPSGVQGLGQDTMISVASIHPILLTFQ